MNEFLNRLQIGILKGTRYNDLLLAVLVMAVIALMIMPVPPFVLDILIGMNLTISVVLLMISLYIPGILAFSTFPTLLLFTTLFRLSLSITTTRAILLHAHAGEIIFTFGNFVVGGNFIVGTVIFLIITIVQFIVITKGSERVAEVGARFTLDAMPGKQMSIDADLRAGTIDMDTAKKRRSDLEKENQLYGAMDGAMKFVKGDAIASLIITAINILAGISIGVFQKAMEMDKALKIYTILTIGEGLVAQIPALLISITAGIIVTRVASEEGTALGGEIGGQILAQPKALLIGAGMCLAMALIPGFPKATFFVMSVGLAAVGYTIHRAATEPASKDQKGIPALSPTIARTAPKSTASGEAEDFSITVPLMIDVDASVQTSIEPRILNDELVKVRRALYHDLGVPFPGIHLRFNEGLTGGAYRILLHEVPMSQGTLKTGHLLVREKEDNLKIIGIPFQADKNFLPNIQTLWVEETHRPQLTASGIGFMDPSQILTYHLSFILKKYSHDFIGVQETKFLLERMEQQFPEVVREVQRVLPVQKITEIFQRLVQEEISIRNLRAILQSLIDWGQKEKESVLLTEYVRSTLRRYISYKFSGGQNILAVYLVDQDTEEKIRKAIRQTSAGAYLALDPAIARRLVDTVKKQVGTLSSAPQRPVLLTSMDVRRYIRKLIELEVYELPVLSHQELTDEITIQPLGKISV